MSEEVCCLNGNPNCDFNIEHEQALVSELMRVIERYNKREDIDFCPLCLRDTMLAVAALLHIEAARIRSKSTDRPPPRPKKLGDALARAARNALENVTMGQATLFSSRGRN
jgi:hypothetical protein